MPTSATTTPGVHYTTLERKIPAWLKHAPPETHRALRNGQQAPAWLAPAIQRLPEIAKAWQAEHARHREHQAQVQKLFERLPDLQTFAAQALTEAIKQRFGLDLDVHNTYLVDARLIDTAHASDARSAVNQATRSLLHSALHNFDQDAAAEHGMDAPKAPLKKSVILDHRRFMGTVPITNAVDISAEDVADLCRALDIGGKYHQLVHAIYYPAASRDEAALAVYETLGRAEVSAFRQTLHFARLKGDISEAFYIAALAAPLDRPQPAGSAVMFSLLSLWEVELTGVVLITLQAGGHQATALYIPGDDTEPLKEHASREALQNALRDRLHANIAYLDPHIADRDKASVFARLQDRLAPLRWSVRGVHERVPDPHATLYPVERPFAYAFQGVLAFQKAQRHEQDVLFHAIPTEIVDRRTAQAHRELIAGRVLTALNIAGFFVPGLGEAMLAVCMTQLAYEVYEGIEAWENDERDTAFGYLCDVIENVAIMAALGAAAKALRVSGGGEGPGNEQPEVDEPELERIAVETPSFIEELEDVQAPDGQVRLWKPDLTPYQSHEVLPAGLVPDELGLRHHQGKRWLVQQGSQYIVDQASISAEFRLQHPESPHRYQPPVRHNGAGAWLHITDKPLSWSGMALLSRMGHLSTHFDETTLQQILAVSGTHEDVLRRALADNRRLPALLEDTLQRFKLDETTRQLTQVSARLAEFTSAYARLADSTAPRTETLQRVYPHLPTAVADELVREASISELQVLDTGKVPLRLGEEIRVYQQHIRLARACEGLYLACVPSWDSDRLIMHTLERLPGWPAATKLQVLQRLSWPAQAHGIGPLDARPYQTITHAEAGYIVHDENRPGTAVTVYPSLYAALYEALPEAMTQLGVADQHALQRLVQQSPLPPRSTLRTLLGMQPVRPGYRSPMRLADGRLGYPLSGGGRPTDGITRQRLLEAVEATGLAAHTGRSAEQVLIALASRGRTTSQIFDHLQTLLEQRTELQSRLDDWSEAISPATEQAVRDYDSLRDAILQHWYDTALDEGTQRTAELRITRVPMADIPMTLPGFFYSRVRSLSLIDLPSGALAGWAQHERLLQRLLRQMPQIESLEINRPYDPRATPSSFLFSVPTITEHLPGLQRLVMTNQNIALSESDLNLLAGLRRLRSLDLSGNRLAQHNSPSFHELSLDYLGLDQMQLAQWPIGIGSDALGRIAHLSLRNNNLRSLPAFLFNETDALFNAPAISLQGNSINETHLQRLLLSERGETANITVDVPAALTARLANIRSERQQMRDAIDGWAQASSSSNPLTQAALTDRHSIETAISQFWEQQERGHPHLEFRLEEVALEHFPRRLPAFFHERVHAMRLTHLSGTASQLDGLLARFPNITRLTIDGHQGATSSLASALRHLRQVTYLEFRNMGLEVDQAMLDIFAQLQHLTSLDLSGNRLGMINEVPAQLRTHLQSLALTNMSLQAWPAWCDNLLPLELLDLSANNITQLPDHILSNLSNPMPISSIALFDNPLPLDTIMRVRAFSDSQHSYSFALDIPDNLMLVDTSSEGSLNLDHPHFPLQGDDTPRLEDWMLGNALQNEALQDCWQTLQGSDLLRLAGRLRNAAPYVDPNTRGSFCERVRMMLVVATSNEVERPVMESIAAAALPDPETGSQTCHDGALQEFNNIELYLMGRRLMIDAGDTLQTLRQRLLQLFRIEQLELLANKRSGSGDLVSVRLAYRRELAKELDLPIADSMRFRGAANLTRDELPSVLEKIRKLERSDVLVDYMLANKDWAARLRAEYAKRFEEIDARFGLRVLELANADYSLAQELDLQQGLQHEKEQEERELLRELTIAQLFNH